MRVTAATRSHILLSLIWLAMFAQWTTVVPIVVPDQVAMMLGAAADARKEAVSGMILAAGALVALVVAPLAGALSDASRNPQGRRRSHLLWGVLGSCAGLLLLLPFGPGSSLVLYGAAFLFLQFWWNWVSGAYAGLIPDMVPPAEHGPASAWLNIMTVGGNLVGNIIILALYKPGHPAAAMASFVALNLTTLAVTRRTVHEPRPSASSPVEWRGFMRGFYIDPHAHPAFYWVLVTRLFTNMGIWSVFTFLLFYLGDVIGVAEPTQVLPGMLGVGAVLAIPASVAGIRLAGRYGLVRVTALTNAVMAGSAVGFVVIAAWPSLLLVVPAVLLFAASYGAYQSVDWALALRVLPGRGSAGRDMGIWHVAMVLPQVLGPALSGWMISGIKASAGAPAAYVAAFGIGAAWMLLAAALVTRVRLPS